MYPAADRELFLGDKEFAVETNVWPTAKDLMFKIESVVVKNALGLVGVTGLPGLNVFIESEADIAWAALPAPALVQMLIISGDRTAETTETITGLDGQIGQRAKEIATLLSKRDEGMVNF